MVFLTLDRLTKFHVLKRLLWPVQRPLSCLFLRQGGCLLVTSLLCINVMAVTISIVATQKSPPDLSGAVVYLTPLQEGGNGAQILSNQVFTKNESVSPLVTSKMIAQENRQFTPYIKIVQTGTAVSFPNRDTVSHHVYSFSKNKSFELPLYQPGASHSEIFDSAGLVTIGCNIHDWMLSYLMVVDTPFYGQLIGERVEINNVPVGAYRLSLWYPGLRPAKPIDRDVTINDDKQILAFNIEKKLRKFRGQPSAVLKSVIRSSRY